MSFPKWEHEFEGAHNDPNLLRPEAGVYVIWCQNGDHWTILDVGESEDVVSRINSHDRRDCWFQNCRGIVRYSATYISSQQERLDLENKIRSQERVACGER